MAITIKRKEAGPVLEGLPKEDLTQRQVDALLAVGLGPEVSSAVQEAVKTVTPQKPAPIQKPGITIRRVGSFTEGDKVKVTNDLFTWVEWWKPGDTGTVLKVHHQSEILKPEDRKRYVVVQVKLDKVRVHGREVCLFHAWELEKVVSHE